jgi:hypothetical protein
VAEINKRLGNGDGKIRRLHRLGFDKDELEIISREEIEEALNMDLDITHEDQDQIIAQERNEGTVSVENHSEGGGSAAYGLTYTESLSSCPSMNYSALFRSGL